MPAPVTAVYLWFEVGAVDEPAGLHGAAHFLEHMLFKGTQRRSVGDAPAEIEGLGGDLNAYTAHDNTVLHATVDGARWIEALDVLDDMARESLIDPEEFEREKQVVLEEIRSYADDPGTVVYEALQQSLFGLHPYGRPVLGTEASVRGIDRDGLARFWRSHYRPNRATLAIVGDVDPASVIGEAKRRFGSWAPGPERSRVAAPIVPIAPIARRVGRNFQTELITLGWPAPPLDHPDLPALDVLAAALGQGRSSRLTERLELRLGLAHDTWAESASNLAGGMFGLGLYPARGKAAEAVRAAVIEVGRASRGGLSGSVVARAREGLLAEQAFSSETVDTVAHDLVWYRRRYGDAEGRHAYARALSSVRPADVQRVAAAWLKPEQMRAAAASKELDDAALHLAIRPANSVARTRRTGPEVHTLPNGARIAILEDEGPVVGLRLLSPGGGLLESVRRAGVASAWSRMLTEGAGERDATAFGRALDHIAANLDGISTRSSSGLHGSFPACNLEEGLALFGDAIRAPHFDDEAWERISADMLDSIETRGDRADQVAADLVWRRLFPDHPWRLPWGGTMASVQRITTSALHTHHQLALRPDRVVVGVAGAAQSEVVLEALGAWLADLPDVPRPELPPLLDRVDHGNWRGRGGQGTAVIRLATRGAALSDPSRLPLRVAAAILGAQGGRLFLQLREEAALAYHVWCSSASAAVGGLFGAGLVTQPSRREEALNALQATLLDFAEQGPTPQELERAKRMLAGQAAAALQTASGRAADLASSVLHNMPWGLPHYRAQIQAVDRDAVIDAIRSIGLEAPVTAVVEP
jgi:zinc protease